MHPAPIAWPRELRQDGHLGQAPRVYEGEWLAGVDIQSDEPNFGYLGGLWFV